MPAVAREGDSVMSQDGKGYKCRVPMETATDQHSSKVKADGMWVVGEGMKVMGHPCSAPSPCTTDNGVLNSFSSKVKAGGKWIGRVGDQYLASGQTPNIISQGSSKVFAA